MAEKLLEPKARVAMRQRHWGPSIKAAPGTMTLTGNKEEQLRYPLALPITLVPAIQDFFPIVSG